MWTVATLLQGYPGKTAHHGGLGWSTVALARGPEGRVAVLDTGGLGARRVLLARLEEEGVAPGDVTDLLITHLHHDHCVNWPVFGNATIHVGAAEMDWARSLPTGHPLVPEIAIAPLAAHPRLVLLPPEGGTLPGITHVTAPGHTMHHLVFTLEGAPPVIFSADVAKNLAEVMTGTADMTMDAAAHAASIAALRAAWAARPGAVLLPGHDLPMVLEGGRPVRQGRFRAVLTATFGETAERRSSYDLAP